MLYSGGYGYHLQHSEHCTELCLASLFPTSTTERDPSNPIIQDNYNLFLKSSLYLQQLFLPSPFSLQKIKKNYFSEAFLKRLIKTARNFFHILYGGPKSSGWQQRREQVQILLLPDTWFCVHLPITNTPAMSFHYLEATATHPRAQPTPSIRLPDKNRLKETNFCV